MKILKDYDYRNIPSYNNNLTNEEVIERALAEIIARGNNPYYPMEQHMKDMDLIAELTELKLKYK